MLKYFCIALLLLPAINSLCIKDGILSAGQQCDPFILYIPCTDNCVKTCGDGLNNTNSNQDCDYSAGYNGAIPCSSNCRFCGNGNFQPFLGEECDRTAAGYNPLVDQACDYNCKLTCGNGIVQPVYGQQCETVNPLCDANCHFVCGNGVLDGGQTCDYSAPLDPNRNFCLQDCTFCGNGRKDPLQQCDPTSGDDIPCFSNCIRSCGNGIVQLQLGEQCDGLKPYGRPCDPLKCIDTCGNGALDAGEQCDSSDPANPFSDCSSFTCTRTCGNSALDSGEICDASFPGAATSLIPCSGSCSSTCGNSIVDLLSVPAEQCDPTAAGWNYLTCDKVFCLIKNNGIITSFIPSATCGNGIVEGAEQCDDGNANQNDYCDNNCQRILNPAARCGNGVLDVGQQCQKLIMPFCDNNCRVTLGSCGDGVLGTGQQCDDGNNFNNDGCTAYCYLEEGFVCVGTICSKCGNFKINYELGQTCDDGNYINGDGCNSQCQIQAIENCGDGRLNPGQECDDGNTRNGDGCNRFCRRQYDYYCYIGFDGKSYCSLCGNGVINDKEACDDGRNDPGDGCYQCIVQSNWECSGAPSVCQLGPIKYCGDGIYSPELGQDCDDGDTANNNGCTRQCKLSLGYYCVSEPNKKSICYQISQTSSSCGNGYLQNSQECDDRNVINNDGCNQYCKVETYLGYSCTNVYLQTSVCSKYDSCGNGIQEQLYLEECDDGNISPGDGCSSICTVQRGWYCFGNQNRRSICQQDSTSSSGTNQAICGNGIFESNPEKCDDGNLRNGDGCNQNCQIEIYYSCSSTIGRISSCSPSYTLPVCGNGKLQNDETCEDGNTRNGDGCSSKCQIQVGYACPQIGRSCEKLCGNGQKSSLQQCDDYNSRNGDGCDENCLIEVGYFCRVERGSTVSVCRLTCGNGLRQPQYDEECDDKNLYRNDGCDASCRVQSGWNCQALPYALSVCYQSTDCGNGVYEPQKGQICDDGNKANNDGCSATCRLEDSQTFDCQSIAGQRTVCQRKGTCPSGFNLPEISLSILVKNALTSKSLVGYFTYADIVEAVIIKSTYGVRVDNNLMSRISSVLNSANLASELTRINQYIDLCIGA